MDARVVGTPPYSVGNERGTQLKRTAIPIKSWDLPFGPRVLRRPAVALTQIHNFWSTLGEANLPVSRKLGTSRP